MNERIAAPWIPTWIPDSGHALRHAGIHFDAVRMKAPLAERVASELMRCTDFDAGPIVAEATGDRNMYFLLPPQTAASFRWPPGVRALTRSDRGLAYVGVPALTGMTWPLGWRSVPSEGAPFVVGELLWEAVAGVVGPPDSRGGPDQGTTRQGTGFAVDAMMSSRKSWPGSSQ